MTTRLSQKRVKGGDPAYPTLQDELKARALGDGSGGYVVPTGGIPKSDLSQHVQDLLSTVETSKAIASTGVTRADLSVALQTSIDRADKSYIKPNTGIPETDLDTSIQTKLNNFDHFYVYPLTGIPRVDFDLNVQEILSLAESAYQKPSVGIGQSDLSFEVTSILDDVKNKYVKPLTGIPDADLEERYVTTTVAEKYDTHIANSSIHITDHGNLTSVGRYTHSIIDEKLDSNELVVSSLVNEIGDAREEFSSLGNRLNSLLGLNSFYSVQTKEDWEGGTLQNLSASEEGFVGLVYSPERPVIELFDIETTNLLSPENKLAELYFESDSKISIGSKPWIHGTNRYNDVGLRLEMFIYADKSGTYEFAAQFSGRMKLQVAGQLLFDTQSLYSQVDAYTRNAHVDLEAGRLYKLVFEGWYGQEGERIFGLAWKRPGMTFHSEIQSQYINVSSYDSATGTYISPIIDMKDNNISKWIMELDSSENRAKGDINVWVRTSEDAILFSDWVEIDYTKEILVTPRRFSQVKIEVNQKFEFYSPVVRGFKIRYISSTQNEIMEEISSARAGFLSLQERLDTLDEKMQQVTQFAKLNETNSFHPEFFSSVRLASQELNLLKFLILEADRQSNYILLDNGVVDTFKTSNFIDDALSDEYEILNGSIRTISNIRMIQGDNEWAKWELDRLAYVKDQLQLAASFDDSIIRSVSFGNWYTWSTRDTARIAGNYQAYIAQPFFTSSNINLLTRLQVATYDSWYAPQSTLMVCPTKPGTDLPDVNAPIWSVFLGYGTGTFNYTNLRINVLPETKYWIVVKRETQQRIDGYTRWWLSYNNTSTNGRLRGTNPDGAYLGLKYTADESGQTGWNTDVWYFLTFHMDEAMSFEPEGYGTRIIDYETETQFHSVGFISDLSTDGLITMTYQSSNDAQIWSTEVTDISLVPKARFLKLNLSMQKSSVGYGSPTIDRIEINSKDTYSELITYPMEAKSIPTHAIFHADYDDGITFSISRDNGHTWKELAMKDYTQLDDIVAGQTVRIKIKFDGNFPLSFLRAYGLTFTTYRDITQQNVTALYEEYIAKEGQQIFKLVDPYIVGNYSLQVYVNGIRQSIMKDYIELDQRTVQFTEPLIGGLDADRVTFVVSAGAYDQHDAISHAKIDEMRDLVGELNVPHDKDHVYNELGQLVETTFSFGYYNKRISYEYDASGRKIKETIETKNHIRSIDYIYDVNGRLVKEKASVNGVTI